MKKTIAALFAAAIAASAPTQAQAPTQTPADSIATKTEQIEVVTVRGRVPAITTARGKTVVRIAGSMLQNLPEVTDILRRAPSLRAGESGLEFAGLG